jgi:hypothetical protein
MKRIYRTGFLLLSTAFILFTGCITEPKNSDPVLSVSSPPKNSDPVLSVSSPNTTPSPSLKQANPFYNGRGGRGTSLAILAPQVTGLTENLNYLPTLVQGEFVSNFSGYSAMSVLDRENLDKLFAETLSGHYEDDEEGVIRLGHMANTDYIMTGIITKTSTGYALQMQIASSEDGMTKASYSGTCTIEELDNFRGIRRASLDLLAKMDVELTDRAMTELAGAATANHVNAQTALAQGITAQRSGTVVEALTYYYEAREYDTGLLEATSRLNVLANTITSGNIGENVRNDIQRRNEWLKVLTECEVFFKGHLPYEIIYNPDITQGRIDYTKETVDLSFEIESRPTSGYKVIENVLDGLTKTGKREEWGFGSWPMDSNLFSQKPQRDLSSTTVDFHKNVRMIMITVSLQNDQGKIIATQSIGLNNKVAFLLGTERHDWYSRGNYQHWGQRSGSGAIYLYDTCRFDLLGDSSIVRFRNVNANDITDSLTIICEKIDGIDAEIANKNGYIKISMKN